MTEIVNEREKIELAKAYVALSNAHKLEFVVPMFAVNAIYQSPNIGVFNGRGAIGGMMTSFFSRFPDVFWEARDYRCTNNGDVRFDFQMTAREAGTGEEIRRAGVEEMEFTSEGLIVRLEVRNL
jgi:SnoaL-like domain